MARTECQVKGVLKKVGRLYLFQHCLCFESDVFGTAQADKFPLDQVSDLELDKKTLKFVHAAKKHTYINLRETDKFGSALLPIWQSLHGDQPAQDKDAKKSTKGKEKEKDKKGKELTRSNAGSNANADPSAAVTMGPDDWALLLEVPPPLLLLLLVLLLLPLLQGAKLVGFADGEYVIKEGMQHHRIYQVASGKCIIKKNTDQGEITLGQMEEGALFGEMTFLEKGNATASIIASGDVQIYIIEGYFINILFVDYPDLAGRFYSYLATVLAQRLSDRELKIQQELQKAAEERRRRRREAKEAAAATK